MNYGRESAIARSRQRGPRTCTCSTRLSTVTSVSLLPAQMAATDITMPKKEASKKIGGNDVSDRVVVTRFNAFDLWFRSCRRF